MNKSNTGACKKSLVRNTEQKVPNVVVTAGCRIRPKTAQVSSARRHDSKPPNSCVKFDEPKVNSTKNIAEKMKKVQNVKSREIKSADARNSGFLDERITKQMNFPHEKPIYKDLIPLCVKMQSQPLLASRDPLPLKDKEPVLNDFFTPRSIPEYSFQVSNQRRIDKEENVKFNGVKLYNHIQTWSKRHN